MCLCANVWTGGSSNDFSSTSATTESSGLAEITFKVDIDKWCCVSKIGFVMLIGRYALLRW